MCSPDRQWVLVHNMLRCCVHCSIIACMCIQSMQTHVRIGVHAGSER